MHCPEDFKLSSIHFKLAVCFLQLFLSNALLSRMLTKTLLFGADLRAFLLESRYNSAPELPLLDHQIPPLPDNPWGNDASTRGANHQRSQIRSTDVTASPGTARIGSEATPGIIRAQSQDFTIE